MILWVGIDPGLEGAVVTIDENSTLISFARTPVLRDRGKVKYDVQGMVRAINETIVSSGGMRVAIEDVHAMPGQGVTSMFTFGYGAGLWRGIAAGLGLTVHMVSPRQWSRLLGWMPQGKNQKLSAARRARDLWPSLPLDVKANWGMADAALIAETARRDFTGARQAPPAKESPVAP